MEEPIPARSSYINIKDHFLTKFAEIDETLPSCDSRQTRSVLTEFIQEGIGALLAYLPREVAKNTLSDFMIVLRMGHVTDKREEPKVNVDQIRSDTQMILQRLDAVKKQVEDT